jgi:hypothetical protein
LFADVGQGEQEEEQAGEEDHAEGGLPRDAATDHDGVREISVQRHARGESNGVVGPQTHDERGDGGGCAGGEEDAFDGHARFGEDAGIYDHHVSHGHKGGEAGEKFAADGGLIFVEVKEALEQAGFPLGNRGHYRCATEWCQTQELVA